MIYCATGHRPHRLGGYNLLTEQLLESFALTVLNEIKPTKMIVGMALGWDTAVAAASRSLSIPYIAAVPYKGQGTSWDYRARTIYESLLSDAEEVVYVSELYKRDVFEKRDKWMVDNSESVIALFDGELKGGTWMTVNYANHVEKTVINFWDEWEKHSAQKR